MCRNAGAGERAAGQQQGLAGEEGRDHETGLGEDGREDRDVGPQAQRLDRLRQVGVEVEDVVEQLIHACHRPGDPGRRLSRARPRRARRRPARRCALSPPVQTPRLVHRAVPVVQHDDERQQVREEERHAERRARAADAQPAVERLQREDDDEVDHEHRHELAGEQPPAAAAAAPSTGSPRR